MKIGIIGGGLTGLAAAYNLRNEHDVAIFEKMPYPGGCLSSYRINDYAIERYYHHCFSSDRHFFALLGELGLSGNLEWHTGTTGYYSRQRIFPLSTPLQILRYPELSLADKARLAWLTVRAKKMDMTALDGISAEQYIVDHLGRRIYSSFFEPLLKSKFGECRRDVSAAWLMSRIAIRSDRGMAGEHLGYLNGGFCHVIDRIGHAIEAAGGKISTHSTVTSVTRNNGRWKINNEPFDCVISTVPPQELGRISDLPMPSVPYQGAACMTLGLERDVSDGIYWLNMKDKCPYGAVIAHTNFVPFVRYGEHIVYLASYFTGSVPPGVDRVMLEDFSRRFAIAGNEIHWHRMAVDPWAGPVYTTGYRSLIPACERHGLFLAGMFSRENYPERSMEGSLRAGLAAAECIRRRDRDGRT